MARFPMPTTLALTMLAPIAVCSSSHGQQPAVAAPVKPTPDMVPMAHFGSGMASQ